MARSKATEKKIQATQPAAVDMSQYRKIRKYTGPAKGSDEAKARMNRVRAAQYAKNGLVQQ